jgi:hypothetical protein
MKSMEVVGEENKIFSVVVRRVIRSSLRIRFIPALCV